MSRQELYVVLVLAHLQVLAMLATVPLEVRCKPLNYILTSVMLKMRSSHIRDASQLSPLVSVEVIASSVLLPCKTMAQ